MKQIKLKKESFVAEVLMTNEAELSFIFKVDFKETKIIADALKLHAKSIVKELENESIADWRVEEITFEHSQSLIMASEIFDIRYRVFQMMDDYKELALLKIQKEESDGE